MGSVKQSSGKATIDDVRRAVTGGVSISTAIKEMLAKNGIDSVVAFAEKYDINRTATNSHIAGSIRPSDATLSALISEFGGTEAEWRELLWLAGKPSSSTSAA